MATPNQRAILSNLKTTLEAITTGGGYKNTVATVALTAQDWASAQKSGALPWLGIVPKQRRHEYKYSNTMRTVFPVAVVAHLTAATDSTAYDKAADIIDDIIAAVHVDSTRGGNAIDTKVVSDDDDSGDPDRIMGATGGTVTAVVDLEITFMRTTSSS